MKNLKMIMLFVLTVFLVGSGCKKKASDNSNDDQNQTPDEAVFEAFNLLNDTYDMFYEKAATVPDSPKEAIMLTDEWLNTQDMVEETEVFDSAYINIFTKAGVETTFNLIPVNADSTPIYRGSGGLSGGKLTSYINRENPCANVIQNKKVLIFAAAFLPKQKILDYFDKSDIGFDVTVKKIKECDPGLVDTFKDYGLVILDTHGDADAFLTGLKIEFKEKPADLETFKAEIIKQAGTANYERFLNGYLKFSHGIRYNPFEQHYWEKPILPIFSSETVWITAKYISTLTGLSNTIIFGNMCYSGYQHPPHPSEKLFIGQAFKNVKPISYYCYAFNTENSFPVADHFARQMEDSLVRSLVVDSDSTGNAYLKANNTEFIDSTAYREKYGYLYFKHFLSPSWCYGGCEDSFTDPRDMQEYKTVCMGKQRWMAENLNYNDGGVCYDDNGSNCDTYGRLYSIDEATGRDTSSTNPSGIRGICPEGWHIPSQAEWEELFDYCGGADEAANKLRATSGWPTPNQNTDEYGFHMQAGGLFTADANNSQFGYLGTAGYFWTSDGNQGGYFIGLNAYYPGLNFYTYSPPPTQTWKFSIRCVKD